MVLTGIQAALADENDKTRLVCLEKDEFSSIPEPPDLADHHPASLAIVYQVLQQQGIPRIYTFVSAASQQIKRGHPTWD